MGYFLLPSLFILMFKLHTDLIKQVFLLSHLSDRKTEVLRVNYFSKLTNLISDGAWN